MKKQRIGKIIKESDAEILNQSNLEATYRQDDKISGLKPYIYYSCRYQQENGNDFVITYSLDNYITIQGVINNQWIFDSGYLLDNITTQPSGKIFYRGIEIDANDETEESMYDPEDDDIKELFYIKLNGVKYYKGENDRWFSILNGKKYKQDKFKPKEKAAIKYYQEAKEFKDRIITYGISDLKTSDVKDDTIEKEKLTEKFGNYNIFDFGNYKEGNKKSIEDPNSNFNQHRLAVIRYSIEKNLSIAIANYNNYSGVQANFRMPTLQEDEWEKIINNVSIISFLQGLNIGGKMYNGYSIITNNKNQEVVNEDSIYILTNDNQYHRANDKDLINNDNIKQGVLNIDFERKSNTNSNGETHYFIPKQTQNSTITGCYTSIVTQSNVEATDNFYQYMEDKGKLAKVYFTALGRERYGMYKTNKNPDDIKKEFGVQ